MLQAVLANPNHPQYGVATIPFPVKNSDYESTMDLLEPLEIGDAVKQDCRIEEIRSELSALKRLERSNANLDEIDYLAKRLDSFDEYEKVQFQGMASRLDLHGIDEFINLSFCCQEATVATDFRGLESLGRRHYLTMNGGSAAVEEMKNKDFREIALALLEGAVGRVTPYGVVYDNDFEMAQLYDGRNFPQYRYEDCLMELEMASRYAPVDSSAVYLYLPVSQTQLERAMLRAGIDNYGDLCIRFLESELPEEVDAALDFENESLSDLNEMCRAIEQLSPADHEKLGAVVALAKPEQANQITNLAKELEMFEYIPKVRTPEEYGKYIIIESGHFEYNENLVGYIDFARYGAERIEHEQGEFVDRGYVAYHGTMQLEMLMADAPVGGVGLQMDNITLF